MWKGIAFLASWAEYRKSLQRLPKNKQHRFILDDRACIFTVDLIPTLRLADRRLPSRGVRWT